MRRAAALAVVVAVASVSNAAAQARQPGAYRAEPLTYAALDRWAHDDHAAALAAFRRSCAPRLAGRSKQATRRPAPGFLAACRAAGAIRTRADDAAARAFFEARFEPVAIVPEGGSGFLTAYYEPEIRGSLRRSGAFSTPLLARPADLVDTPAVGPRAAARRTASGLEPYPDRAAIEEGALGAKARPLVYVSDAVDAFVVHVQGSARIRLDDGRVLRVAYAGRNGQPYTAIGRVLSLRENIPPAEMTMGRLTAWLRDHPAEAPGIMRLNRSYIFFRIADELSSDDGPIGGAGIPLTAGRSLAVDRNVWTYGLPVWLEAELPSPDGPRQRLRRLVIAQDTGTAIVGPARGDLFLGAGEAPGLQAGLVREPVRFVVLRPKPERAEAGDAGSGKARAPRR